MTAVHANQFADDRLLSFGRVLNFGLSILILLTFSQAWVFPMLGDKGDPSASGLVRALFVPAYFMGLGLLAVSLTRSTFAVLRQPFLLILLAIIAASIFWSIAPAQTERRVIALYATTLCAVVLASQRTWVELVELLASAFAVLIFLCFAFAILLPSIGIMHEIFPGAWRGVWPEKNQLGGNMSLGVCIFAAAAVLSPRRRAMWIIFGCLAVSLILLSTSKTSLVAALLGISALIFVLLVQRGPVIATIVTWMAVLAVGALAGLVLFASEFFFEVLGKDATFTGRTAIWGPIMRQIAERPWTGFGYGVFWTETGPWAPVAWVSRDAGYQAQHAHNAWLEQWLGFGLPGLVAFILMQVQFLIGAIISTYRGSTYHGNGGVLALPFFLCYTLMCITESVAVIYNDFRWVLFTAIAVKLAWPDARASEDIDRPPGLARR